MTITDEAELSALDVKHGMNWPDASQQVAVRPSQERAMPIGCMLLGAVREFYDLRKRAVSV